MSLKKPILASVIFLVLLVLLSVLFTVYLNKTREIIIDDAKIVTGVDSQMLPVKVTNFFPKNTEKVSAWISWHSAKINTQILVRWHYVTDDIPIYDYVLSIPKKEGVANVVLSMPQGKTLPSGAYKVDVLLGKRRLIKTLTFDIQ